MKHNALLRIPLNKFMKNYLISLLLVMVLPFMATAQTDSWFELEVQFDFYGPNESLTLITQAGDTLVNYQPSQPYELYETIVYADSGNLDIKIYDTFGDGWNTNVYGTTSYIKLYNSCQGVILDLDLDYAFTQIDTTVVLDTCTAPVIGCMDSNASNYNPAAVYSNDSCKYPVEFTLDMNNYNNTFTTPYVSGVFNGWASDIPMADTNNDGIWNVTVDIMSGQYAWKFMLDSWATQELPPNVQNDPYVSCFTLDAYGFTNRTLTVTDTSQTLPTYCWEKCYECGTVLGCMDSTSNVYNPWATLDDGSCGVTAPTCDPDETYVELIFTPDNWPNETSISVKDSNGNTLFDAPTGTYSGQSAGIPIREFICIDTNTMVQVFIGDVYGDGLSGTSSGGSIDGNVEVFSCDGTELFDLLDTNGTVNIGYQYLSPLFDVGGICNNGGGSGITGCMNPFSTTYNPLATISGSCGPARVVGCTDTSSFNYDAAANQSEIMTGDYTLEIFDGAANGWSGTWLGIKQGNWISSQYKMGPTSGSSITFDVPLNIFEPIELYLFTTTQSVNTINQIGYQLRGPEGDTIVDVPYFTAGPLQFPNIQSTTAQPTFGDVCIPIILGCMDSTSLNYIQPIGDSMVDVNTDDGSCIPIVEGCMNPLAFNYNPLANVDDGSCVPVVVGCMDSTSYNYDPLANTPGACIPIILGCTDPTQFNYDSNANTDDGSCIPFIYGCMDVTALNYDSTANTDDGSCIARIYGCMDSTMYNFNPLANTDDGSCVPFIYGCMDVNSLNYDPLANTNQTSATDFTNPCIPIVYGCTDSTSFNYNPSANVDNGSCVPFIYGCMDPNSFNYDPTANTNQTSATDLSNPCIPIVYGCTDSTSVNYDPLANVDNGSCITSIVGCMDPTAYSYNPLANVSDSTACLYDAGCVGGPGEPYWLNNPCFAWVIDVDNYCCDNIWDSDCQDLYDYCENGYPLDINELIGSGGKIAVYPNPTTDMLSVVTTLNNVQFVLFDLQGKKLRTVENTKNAEIDMRNLSTGIYILQISVDGKIYNKKILKED